LYANAAQSVLITSLSNESENMTFYVVTKARFDDQGEVAQVEWSEANGETRSFIGDQHVVEVDRVVEAFDRGDTVEMRFHIDGHWVSGGKLLRKVLPGGLENVKEERGGDGQQLRDLPTF
jgi:hypothetical protein